ncbi:MAG: RluA family pseudouridine synthase [Candidatus Omnitrophota bacterium]
MQEYKVKVSSSEAGKRLDLYLLEFFNSRLPGISRTFIQRLICGGKVRLENIGLPKQHYKVKAGDNLIVLVEEKKKDTLSAEDIPLEVVYEDQDLAVINKPAGLVVHPAPGNPEHTLVNALLHRFGELSDVNPKRPGIVHRLDKQTSGLLLVAKNNFTHLALARQFAAHSIKRKYIALVKGRVEFDENIIELPIGRHPVKRKDMAVGFGKKTKPALTKYRTLRRDSDFSLLELEPFTGRTHQLRVHLAFIGHPILGDDKYGKNNRFSRLALHAKSLGFIHPRTKRFMGFSCELPEEFTKNNS